MPRKDKIEKILSKINELELLQEAAENTFAGSIAASTKVADVAPAITALQEEAIVEIKTKVKPAKTERVKQIIKKADQMNKPHRPRIVYQGGSKLYLDQADYWSSDDEMECPHCNATTKKRDIADKLGIYMKKHRVTNGGQLKWNEYITEVSKLPDMMGKPRSVHMKVASALKQKGIPLEEIKDVTL